MDDITDIYTTERRHANAVGTEEWQALEDAGMDAGEVMFSIPKFDSIETRDVEGVRQTVGIGDDNSPDEVILSEEDAPPPTPEQSALAGMTPIQRQMAGANRLMPSGAPETVDDVLPPVDEAVPDDGKLTGFAAAAKNLNNIQSQELIAALQQTSPVLRAIGQGEEEHNRPFIGDIVPNGTTEFIPEGGEGDDFFVLVDGGDVKRVSDFEDGNHVILKDDDGRLKLFQRTEETDETVGSFGRLLGLGLAGDIEAAAAVKIAQGAKALSGADVGSAGTLAAGGVAGPGVKLTRPEQRFFDDFFSNAANREELLEAVPSLKIEDGQISVDPKDVDALFKFVEDTVISDGAGAVPPRLKGARFYNQLEDAAAPGGVKAAPAPGGPIVPQAKSAELIEAIEDGDLMDVLRVASTEEQVADTAKASRALAKLPDQSHAKGTPNIAPGVAAQFDDRLDEAGIEYMKWVRNNPKGKFIHKNQKTAASVDFSTTCGKRSCNTGSCLYCYVDEGRVINKERDKAIAAGGTVEDTGLGSAQAKTDKLEHNFDPDAFNKMPKSVIDAFNQDGGLRMFSFGDYRDGVDGENVLATLDAALDRGLFIKAITKSEEFVEQFGDHPALRLNVSMDKVPTDVSNAWTAEKAIAAKQRYPNLRIRSVALNEAEIDEFGKMTMPDGSPLIDVITLYHGKTNFTPKGVRTDKLSKVILAKLNDPEFTPPEGRDQILKQFGGEEGLSAYLDTWKNMTPKGAAHKHARETYVNRVCCTNGRCAADPGTKCGFGVIKEAPLAIIGVLLGLAGAAFPELSNPEAEDGT